VDFIQTVASILEVKNVTLTGRIAVGAAGKHILKKAQQLINRRKLGINLQFPGISEANIGLGEKYLEIGQAVGATYYAAYKKDTMADGAMKAGKDGGIDLNQIKVNRTGNTVNVQFDQAQLNELMQEGFRGFTPVVINVTRTSSPFQLSDISPVKEEESLVKI
jgi:hypothetical protein